MQTEVAGTGCGESMFVKVNMDGVPIGRKIDLKTCNSYEKLARELEEMFKRFIAAQSNSQNLPLPESDIPVLLRGVDYVLIYEDKEGDRMLAGDVPWEMFITTVKRLRIMKSSDVHGLGCIICVVSGGIVMRSCSGRRDCREPNDHPYFLLD